MANYPIPDGTNNMAVVLFPPGVTSFNEDYGAIESYNETEQLYRFNSVVKTPGIVSKKSTEANTDLTKRNLCPIPTGVGNGIIITPGTGYTLNGARISVPLALTVTDITACTGYVNPGTLTGDSLVIVLRKKEEDGYPRTHPLDGSQHNTRRRIKYDNTIVEFVKITEAINELTDKDVVVLGRLISVSPPVFNLTEKVGYRKILRATEALTCETSGFTMEGDIDMNNVYDVLNVPQWGSSYWDTNGVPHNSDFVRLFGRVNSTVVPIAGLKFTTQSGNYGLLSSVDGALFSIIGAQVPVRQIDIESVAGVFKQIPVNSVLYYPATDYDMGLSDILPGRITFDQLPTESITTFNIGETGDIKKIPICWHYFYEGVRRLIFVNGVQLSENDSIRSDGKVSYYVETAGDTMTGDLGISKNEPAIYLTQTVKNPNTTIFPGIKWRDNLGNIVGEFYRKYSQENVTGIEGDHILSVTNPSDNSVKFFDFKRDGRLKVRGSATESDDVITLEYATGSYGYVKKRGDIMSGELIIGNEFATNQINNRFYGNLWIQKSANTDSGNLVVLGKSYLDGNVNVGSLTAGDANLLVYGDAEVGQPSVQKKLTVNGYVSLPIGVDVPSVPITGEPAFNLYSEYIPYEYTNQLSVKDKFFNWRLINKTSSSTCSGETANSLTPRLIGAGVTPLQVNILKAANTYLINININLELSSGFGSRTLTFELKDNNLNTKATFYKGLLNTSSNQKDSVSFSTILTNLGTATTLGLYVTSTSATGGVVIKGGSVDSGGSSMDLIVIN